MTYKKTLFAIAEEKNAISAELIYGDYSGVQLSIRYDPAPLARYAPLGRKILYHYIKDYDPLNSYILEWRIRYLIKQLMLKKIYENKPYDWEYIDHKFRRFVGLLSKTDIPYNEEIIRKTENADALGYAELDFVFRFPKKENAKQEETLPFFYYITRTEWEIALKARDNPELKRQSQLFNFGSDYPFNVNEYQYMYQYSLPPHIESIRQFLPKDNEQWKVAKIPVLYFVDDEANSNCQYPEQ